MNVFALVPLMGDVATNLVILSKETQMKTPKFRVNPATWAEFDIKLWRYLKKYRELQEIAD